MGVCVFQGKCREVEGKQEHAIFDMIWESMCESKCNNH